MNAKQARENTNIAIDNIDISEHIKNIDEIIEINSKKGSAFIRHRLTQSITEKAKIIKHYKNMGFYVNHICTDGDCGMSIQIDW